MDSIMVNVGLLLGLVVIVGFSLWFRTRVAYPDAYYRKYLIDAEKALAAGAYARLFELAREMHGVHRLKRHATLYRGLAQYYQGRTEESAEPLRQVAADNAASGDLRARAFDFLGRMALQCNDLASAEQHFLDAIRAAENPTGAPYRGCAELRWRQGLYEEAVKDARLALDADRVAQPASLVAHRCTMAVNHAVLARALALSGDPAGAHKAAAEAQWITASDSVPAHAEVRAHLEALEAVTTGGTPDR